MVCLIWGTTWISIKVAVESVPPLTSAGLRFITGAPFLCVLVRRARSTPFRYPGGKAWFFAFVTTAYFCIPYLLLNVGEQHISSGLTAIIFASVSVLIVVFSIPVLHASVRPHQLAAVLVAFGALSALVIRREGGIDFRSRLGVAAVLLAAIMHSFAYVMIKRHGRGIHVLTLNTLPIATAGVVLTLAGLVLERPDPSSFQVESLAIAYLGVVASVAGFLAYFWLLQRLSTVTLSFVFVLFPIIAQAVSVVVEHQRGRRPAGGAGPWCPGAPRRRGR